MSDRTVARSSNTVATKVCPARSFQNRVTHVRNLLKTSLFRPRFLKFPHAIVWRFAGAAPQVNARRQSDAWTTTCRGLPLPRRRLPDGVLTLAVFHRSEDVEPMAPLKLATGIRLEFFKKGSLWTRADARRRRALGTCARRRIASLRVGAHRQRARRVLQRQQPTGLVELSRALGFRAHLSTRRCGSTTSSARWACVRRSISPIASTPPRPGSCSLASRPEAVGELVRAVNASLDPAEVAQALVDARHRVAAAHGVVRDRRRAGRRAQAPRQADPEAGLKSAVESFADVVVRRGSGRARHQLRRRPRRRARAPGEVGRGLAARLAARRQRQRRRRARRPRPRPGAPPARAAAGARRRARACWSSRRPTRWPTPCASRAPRPCR